MVASVLLAALLGTLFLSLLLFGIGYLVGARSRTGSTAGGLLAVLVIVLPILLIGGTMPLAHKIGSFITNRAYLMTLALEAGLLGGYGFGRKRQHARPSAGAAYVALSLLVIAVALIQMARRNRQIAQVAEQLGINQSTRYEPEKNKACPENLKSIYVAFTMYAQDWDALPPAPNWMNNDDLISKVRQNEWLHCPAVSNRADDKYGYAYNEAVAGRKLNGKGVAGLPNAAKTPLLYDSTNLAKSAHDAAASLPKPGRHGGKDNILYCDGHVEAVTPK